MKTNLEIIQSFYDAFKNNQKNVYLELCDENIEWSVMEGFPNGGIHVGRNKVFDKYFPAMLKNFEEFHATPDEFLSFGDKVIVLGKYHGISKTKKKFDVEFSHVYLIENQKITRFKQYTDTEIIQKSLE